MREYLRNFQGFLLAAAGAAVGGGVGLEERVSAAANGSLGAKSVLNRRRPRLERREVKRERSVMEDIGLGLGFREGFGF